MDNIRFNLIPDFLYFETSKDGEGNYSLDYYNMKPSLFITRKADRQQVIMNYTDSYGVSASYAYGSYDAENNTCYINGEVILMSDPDTDTWKLYE